MSTENTSLKNITPIGDSNTTNEMVVGKINTYQRTFLIVAGSLLALLVWIAFTGTSGGQHLQSSVNEISNSAGALESNNMFGLGAEGDSVSYEHCTCTHCNCKCGCLYCWLCPSF